MKVGERKRSMYVTLLVHVDCGLPVFEARHRPTIKAQDHRNNTDILGAISRYEKSGSP